MLRIVPEGSWYFLSILKACVRDLEKFHLINDVGWLSQFDNEVHSYELILILKNFGLHKTTPREGPTTSPPKRLYLQHEKRRILFWPHSKPISAPSFCTKHLNTLPEKGPVFHLTWNLGPPRAVSVHDVLEGGAEDRFVLPILCLKVVAKASRRHWLITRRGKFNLKQHPWPSVGAACLRVKVDRKEENKHCARNWNKLFFFWASHTTLL